jgi:hypothetical protein
MAHFIPSTNDHRKLLVALALALFAGLLIAQVALADHEAGRMNEPDRLRSIEAEAVRWIVKGEGVEAQRLRSVEANVTHWLAKGEFYTGQSAFDPAPVVDAQAATWVLKGQYYEAQRQRALDAQVEHWLAKGAYYTQGANVQR